MSGQAQGVGQPGPGGVGDLVRRLLASCCVSRSCSTQLSCELLEAWRAFTRPALLSNTPPLLVPESCSGPRLLTLLSTRTGAAEQGMDKAGGRGNGG